MNYDGITLNLAGSRRRFYKHKIHDHTFATKYSKFIRFANSLHAVFATTKYHISHTSLPYASKVKNDISLNSSIMTLCNDGIIDRRVISLRAFRRRRRRKYGHFELADS